MPDVDTLLSSLATLAATHRLVAQAWHGTMLLALIAWLAGWRPRPAFALAMLALPLGSAGLLALVDGLWFNGFVMTATAAACAALGAVPHGDHERRRGRVMLRPVALLLLAFAWLYPHFAPVPWFPAGLYSSPVGVLPCPTLALALGVAMLAGGRGSRTANYIIVAVSLFYGVVGVLVLGVAIDAVLVGGALALATQDQLQHRPSRLGPLPRLR